MEKKVRERPRRGKTEVLERIEARRGPDDRDATKHSM